MILTVIMTVLLLLFMVLFANYIFNIEASFYEKKNLKTNIFLCNSFKELLEYSRNLDSVEKENISTYHQLISQKIRDLKLNVYKNSFYVKDILELIFKNSLPEVIEKKLYSSIGFLSATIFIKEY